ncbi:MAG: helix-turn-helix domain-containing protein [Bacteroides sp.]|nr:helix-turn-helix domain-containing protein [Bacillota bacterium]MCM1393517.1 helix-turn-helix domain-containing protein [[Eubacterium] siraeum]MCM1455110.1 helix-turn-helix domain-containing protein [Bacteroides sp.]
MAVFNDRFNELVVTNQVNLTELAKFCGIAKSNVSNWRKGTNVPSLEVFTLVCKYLDVSADYLLGLSDY